MVLIKKTKNRLFKYENVVRLAFQKKFYSKTRMDGHITISEKRVLGWWWGENNRNVVVMMVEQKKGGK